MTWRTPWTEKIAPQIVASLWHGEDVATLATRHQCERDDVRRIATDAGLTLTERRGRSVALEGSGWCMVLHAGKVYGRARREAGGTVSLLNTGPRAGMVVVPWAEIEAYAPVTRYGHRAAAVRQWVRNPHWEHTDTRPRRSVDSLTGQSWRGEWRWGGA